MPTLHAIKDSGLGLATDQYELTMAMAYWKNGLADWEAEFHMFFRNLPFGGGRIDAADNGIIASPMV